MNEQTKEPAVTPHRLIGIFIDNGRQKQIVMWKINPQLLEILNRRVANE